MLREDRARDNYKAVINQSIDFIYFNLLVSCNVVMFAVFNVMHHKCISCGVIQLLEFEFEFEIAADSGGRGGGGGGVVLLSRYRDT